LITYQQRFQIYYVSHSLQPQSKDLLICPVSKNLAFCRSERTVTVETQQ